MTTKRTNIDFSKHDVILTQAEGKYGEKLTVHHLILPTRSSHHAIKYINTCGVLVVTGDFGNWIFCREFHPTADGGVSASYWDEKAHILSSQVTHEWDPDQTAKEWQEMLDDKDQDWDEETREFIEGCIAQCSDSDEVMYQAHCITEMPSGWDPCSTIFAKRRKMWLNAVYDGFDEICKRLKEGGKIIDPYLDPDWFKKADKGQWKEGEDKYVTIRVEVGDYILKADEVPLVKMGLSELHSKTNTEIQLMSATGGASIPAVVDAIKLKHAIEKLGHKMQLFP